MDLSKLANRIYFNQNQEGLSLIIYKEKHPSFEFNYGDKFQLSNKEDGFVYILKGMKENYKKYPMFLFHKCKRKVHEEIWVSLSSIYSMFTKIS